MTAAVKPFRIRGVETEESCHRGICGTNGNFTRKPENNREGCWLPFDPVVNMTGLFGAEVSVLRILNQTFFVFGKQQGHGCR